MPYSQTGTTTMPLTTTTHPDRSATILVPMRIENGKLVSSVNRTLRASIPEETSRKGTIMSKSSRPRLFLSFLSLSVVLGGVLAKTAISKLERWDQLCQEDSLAYDLAYTSHGEKQSFIYLHHNDNDYGSCASASVYTAGPEWEKFDL